MAPTDFTCRFKLDISAWLGNWLTNYFYFKDTEKNWSTKLFFDFFRQTTYFLASRIKSIVFVSQTLLVIHDFHIV